MHVATSYLSRSLCISYQQLFQVGVSDPLRMSRFDMLMWHGVLRVQVWCPLLCSTREIFGTRLWFLRTSCSCCMDRHQCREHRAPSTLQQVRSHLQLSQPAITGDMFPCTG